MNDVIILGCVFILLVLEHMSSILTSSWKLYYKQHEQYYTEQLFEEDK